MATTGNFNTYLTPYEKGTAFDYIYDPNWIAYNGAKVAIATGAFRPLQASDFGSSVSVSGLSVTVGAVAITGNPQVTVSNALAITGNPIVTPASGNYSAVFSGFNNGQAQIPIGAKDYSIGAISGNLYINGYGPIPAPFAVAGGEFDGRQALATVINFGLTGGLCIYAYEV